MTIDSFTCFVREVPTRCPDEPQVSNSQPGQSFGLRGHRKGGGSPCLQHPPLRVSRHHVRVLLSTGKFCSVQFPNE